MRRLGLVAFGFLAGFLMTSLFWLALWHRQVEQVRRQQRDESTHFQQRGPGRPRPPAVLPVT